MRRNKLCKRVLSVTLATVLALGSPIAMGPSGAVGPTTAKAAETDIEDGLVAYYKFEGNLDNSVPDGAPAKLHVGGISEAWVSGSTGEEAYGDDTDGRGKAYSFTGSKEDGTRGDGLELGVKTSENFSISLWVNASEKINFQPIFFTNIDLVNYITAGTYYNNYASGGIVDYKGVLHYLDKNNSCESNLTDLKENEWTHVALTFNNSGKATLYYNGGILSTRTISDYDGSLKNMPIYLGVNLWDPSFKGLMDEVRVYDRELTQAEVIALAGKPQTTKITLTPNEETVTNTAYYVGDDASKTVKTYRGKVTITPTVEPAGAFNEKFDWSVSPADAATCVDGEVTLTENVKDGQNIEITATPRDGGTSGTCTLTAKVEPVKLADVTNIEVEDIPLTMEYGSDGAPACDKNKKSVSDLSKYITITAKNSEGEKDPVAGEDIMLELVDGEDAVFVDGDSIIPVRDGEATVKAVWKYNTAIESKPFKVTVTGSGNYGENYTFGKNTSKDLIKVGIMDKNSNYERLDGNFDIEYIFHNQSNGNDQWNNFILAIADGTGRIANFRADRWIAEDSTLLPGSEAGLSYNNDVWTVCTVPDWLAWEREIKEAGGVDVKIRVTRKNNVLYVTYKYTVNETTTYDLSSAVSLADGVGPTLYMTLSGLSCEYKIENVAPAAQDIQLGTNASQDVKLSDILPVNVTEEASVVSDVDDNGVTSDGVVQVTPGDDKVTFKGLKNGTTTVKVTANGLTVDCNITVSDIAVSAVELSEKEVTLKKGDTKKLTATVKPEGAANQTVTWTSSDPKVATVEDGTITAVAAGTATITAAVGAVSATCTVTVTDETAAPGETDTPGGSTSGTAIAVESVTLDQTTAELEIGASTTLTATVKPDNASNKDVAWSTSDANVATVDATGKVTAVAAGTATITVTSKSNEKAVATCTITVKAPTSGDNNDDDNNNGNVSDNNNDNNNNNSDNNNDSNNNSGSDNSSAAKEPEATTATVTNTSGVKETVKTTEDGKATVTKVKSSKKSVTVSSTVKVNGVKYTVTAVAANAFAKCKNVTKVTLPATIKTFKKKAFTGAKKVKTIVVKSKKAITVKKGAFKGLKTKKITIKAGKMSKKQLKKFKKSLKKAGFKGKVKKK